VMPRSFIQGAQVLDRSIEADDLATDSVITEKIKDGNVTCQKLAPGLCDRFLASDAPIGRVKMTVDYPADVDFDLPNGIQYDPITFLTRIAIYRNGQLLFNGLVAPVDDRDPTDVYPGSSNTKVKFVWPITRGDTIQVMAL